MYTLHIEHDIKDFEMWKAAFDRDPIGRPRSGVRAHRISRPVDDAHHVVVELDFDRSEDAASFLDKLERTVWNSAATSPALNGAPKTRIVDLVANESY